MFPLKNFARKGLRVNSGNWSVEENTSHRKMFVSISVSTHCAPARSYSRVQSVAIIGTDWIVGSVLQPMATYQNTSDWYFHQELRDRIQWFKGLCTNTFTNFSILYLSYWSSETADSVLEDTVFKQDVFVWRYGLSDMV